jgi:hypothetical protein
MVVFGIGVLALLLFRSNRQARLGDFQKASAVRTNTNPTAARTAPAPQRPVSFRGQMSLDELEIYKRDYRRLRLEDPNYDWKRPLNFWGKVLDQNDEPVPEAEISFQWTDMSPAGTTEVKLHSDLNGEFALLDRTGKRLIIKVQKSGYYMISGLSHRSFEYASPFDQNWHQPDPNQPVVFRLWKAVNPEKLYTKAYRLRIPHTGTAKGYSFLGEGGSDAPDLVAQITVSTNYLPQRLFDWHFTLDIPNGGLAQATEPMPFTAPETGYSNHIEVTKTVGTPEWNEAWKGKYYVTFGPPQRFGLVEFDLSVGWPRFYSNAALDVTYWINTNGSRNLEKHPTNHPGRAR